MIVLIKNDENGTITKAINVDNENEFLEIIENVNANVIKTAIKANQKRLDRYANDPEFREKEKERRRQHYYKKKQEKGLTHEDYGKTKLGRPPKYT